MLLHIWPVRPETVTWRGPRTLVRRTTSTLSNPSRTRCCAARGSKRPLSVARLAPRSYRVLARARRHRARRWRVLGVRARRPAAHSVRMIFVLIPVRTRCAGSPIRSLEPCVTRLGNVRHCARPNIVSNYIYLWIVAWAGEVVQQALMAELVGDANLAKQAEPVRILDHIRKMPGELAEACEPGVCD